MNPNTHTQKLIFSGSDLTNTPPGLTGVMKVGNSYIKEVVNLVNGKQISDLPPKDGCCQRCGRHKSKLTPFGKLGDKLPDLFAGVCLGNTGYDGLLLVKNYRYSTENIDELKANEEVHFLEDRKDMDAENELKQAGFLRGTKPTGLIVASWECRRCFFQKGSFYTMKKG